MMKKIIIGLMALSSLVLAQDTKKQAAPKVKCIISGDEIDLAEYSTYKAGKVYFCCGGCKEEFNDNGAKFTSAANFQLVATGQYSQTNCPVSGRGVKATKFVTVEGTKVSFCCSNCLGKANESKDKVSLLFSDASFGKGFSVSQKKDKVKKTKSME